MISVIMPVFNEEKYLERAILSVLYQTFSDFEFIIINDGSQDDTLKIAQEFQKKDKRIKIINHAQNKGLVNSLNDGISIAKGEYIARMDGDDICVFNRFEKQIIFLKNNPEVKLVGSFIDIIDSEDNIIGEECFFTKGSDILSFSLIKPLFNQQNNYIRKISVCQAFSRKNFYQ